MPPRTEPSNGREAGVRSSRVIPAAFLAFVVASATVFVLVASAGAVPRAELMARAKTVKGEIDALDKQTEILAEDYNAAREMQAELAAQKRTAAKRLKATKKRTGTVQDRLNERAQGMYRQGPAAFLEVLLGARDFQSFAATWDFMKVMNDDDAHLLEELKEAKVEQARAERRLAAKVDAAKKVSTALAVKKQSIESKLVDRRRKLAGYEEEVAALDRAEERRRTVQAAHAVQSAASPAQRDLPAPTRKARSEVVDIAKRYLGRSLRVGSRGPQQLRLQRIHHVCLSPGGRDLAQGEPRPDQCRSARQSKRPWSPGTSVFGNPIHHVGIYVGSGMMIHSPRTGDVVKISPLHDDFVGATRP